MNYFENLSLTLRLANRKSLEYGDGHAWNNRKKKNLRRHAPRGGTWRKLDRLRTKNEWENMVEKFSYLEGRIKNMTQR